VPGHKSAADAVAEVHHPVGLIDGRRGQLHRRLGRIVEEPDPVAQQHPNQVQADLVDDAGGEGLVDGSVSTQPGDLGRLRFRQPTGTAPGWVTFYDASSDGSNGILQATMVRVQFAAATPAPRILAVTTSPRLRTLGGGWLEVPPGAGTVVFSVNATHTHRVRFVLTPTGNETGPYAQLLGEDRDPRDGFTLTWRYPSDGLSAHLDIQAIGPGGTTDKQFGIVH
jgi:hypothetical protein